MKRRGRPSLGVDLVDTLGGTSGDRHRLKLVLRTLTGEVTVKAASRELGVSETRFHDLRRQVLEGALSATEPGMPGRPRKEEPADTARTRELEGRVKWLEEELQCALVRTEIALVMPHLLKRSESRRKKKGASTRRLRRGPASIGGSDAT